MEATLDLDAIEAYITDGRVYPLIAELRKLREEYARLKERQIEAKDTIDAFQMASGLCVPAEEQGGDPGGVQPRHVEEHVHALAKRVEDLEDGLNEWVRSEQDQPVGWLSDDASEEDYERGKSLESNVNKILGWLFSEGVKIAERRAGRAK